MSQTHETDTCEVLVVRNLNVAFRQQDAPEVQAVRLPAKCWWCAT
ncbi:hypothetical protein ACP4B6_003715 [Klebsiella pneumoniae]